MWYYTDNKSNRGDTIIAVSETGMCLLKNGTIRESRYRDCVRVNGDKIRIYRLIAAAFLQTVKRGDQTDIDHITHNPKNFNINDVRNLRWCSKVENCQFDEHRINLSNAKKGKPTWNKGKVGCQQAWNKGLSGVEYIAHFKLGKVSNQYTPKEG